MHTRDQSSPSIKTITKTRGIINKQYRPESDKKMIKEITVQELKRKLDNKEDFKLLDVREDFELKISSLKQAIHCSMSDVKTWLPKLDKDQEYVLLCRTGHRSMSMCELMQQLGFKHLTNLEGGINAWATEIDPSLQVY